MLQKCDSKISIQNDKLDFHLSLNDFFCNIFFYHNEKKIKDEKANKNIGIKLKKLEKQNKNYCKGDCFERSSNLFLKL